MKSRAPAFPSIHDPLRWVLALAVSLLAVSPAVAEEARETLFPRGSVWKYLDDGSDPGTAWRGLGFDDSRWPEGPGQFGYGDDDESTIVGFGPDPGNKYITTYFRKTFEIERAHQVEELLVSFLRDDGLVIWLNGTRIADSNMRTPLDTGYRALANVAVANAEESTTYTRTASGDFLHGILREGTNVLAVQVHQASITSSDLSFDLDASVLRRTSPIRQAVNAGGIAYLHVEDAAELLRFDLPTRTWLPPLPLPGTIWRFQVTNDAILFAPGSTIFTMGLDGSTPKMLLDTGDFLRDFVVWGDFVLITTSDTNSDGAFISLDRRTGAVIQEIEVSPLRKALSFSPVTRRLFSRSDNRSPVQIYSMRINTNGTFGSEVKENHRLYPDADQTFTSANGAEVIDSAGVVYDAASMTYRTALAGEFDDLGLSSTGDPIVLRGDEIRSYNKSTYFESGLSHLRRTADRFLIDGSRGFAFRIALETGAAAAEEFTVADIRPPRAGPAPDPTAIDYDSEAIFSDDDSVVFLLDRETKTIFRWSLPKQRYLASIPLGEGPARAHYHAAGEELILDYGTGKINSFDLAGNLGERPVLALPHAPGAMTSMNQFLFLNYERVLRVYNRSGTVLWERDDFNSSDVEYIWHSSTRRLFFISDKSTPNQIIRVGFDAGGQFNNDYRSRSSVIDPRAYQAPLRVSPEGLRLVEGGGLVVTGENMSDTTQLPGSIVDAAYLGDFLFAARRQGNTTTISAYNASNINFGTRNFTGRPRRLLALGDKLVLVTENLGKTEIRLLDANLADVEMAEEPPIIIGFGLREDSISSADLAHFEFETRDAAILDISPDIGTISGTGHSFLPPLATTTLLPQHSRWNYLDTGIDPGSEWVGPGYDDSGWASGPGELGYGDGGEATILGWGSSASNKYITTYFRTRFTATDVLTFGTLHLNLLYDDGAVIYLNGQEVLRVNLPLDQEIDYRTRAENARYEGRYLDFKIQPEHLVEGINVMAVEIHQTSGSSSDLSFDLELLAEIPQTLEYTLTATNTAGDARGAVTLNLEVPKAAFGPAQIVTPGIGGSEVAGLGDFDGDGDTDAAVASPAAAGIFLLFNDGYGRFRMAGAVDPAIDKVGRLVADDLDADGDTDLVAAAAMPDGALWFENDGRGRFTKHVLDARRSYTAVITADLDGDERPEVVGVSPSAGQTWIWKNLGGGDFDSGRDMRSDIFAPEEVGAAHLDGDGKLDLILSSPDHSGLMGYLNGGNLIFPGEFSLSSSDGVTGFAAGDLDGDGHSEVVLTTPDRVLRLSSQAGGAPWTETELDGKAVGCRSPYLGDFDDDGDLDVAYAGVGDYDMLWLKNDGDGNFGHSQTIDGTSPKPSIVGTFDMDFDGDLDIVASGDGGAPLRWYGSLKFIRPVATDDGFEVVEDGALSIPAVGGVLNNDRDMDDGDGPDHLIAELIEFPRHGTLTFGSDGSFAYAPEADYFGPDQFSYQASDGRNRSEPATARILVSELTDLSLSIGSDREIVGAPGSCMHDISLQNSGPSDATNLVIDLTLLFPDGVTVDSLVVSPGALVEGQWRLDLSENESATAKIIYQVDSTAKGGMEVIASRASILDLDQPLTATNDGFAGVLTSIISPADIGVLELISSPGLSLQSGLFTQQVTITNNNPLSLAGFRLLVEGLPDDVRVYNASGTTPGGTAFIESSNNLAVGASITLALEYFRPSLDPDFDPSYRIEAVFTENRAEPATANDGIILHPIATLDSGGFLLEFTSIPGSNYAIEYSHDMSTWHRVTPTITAYATRTQWIDSGPPKTASHPSSATTRFYRVVGPDRD